ncbi:DUF1542 domain-containing protein, partial [Streptococcus sp. 9903]|uniref:DUF1542 domain-containing protein n=1 Tax=Streptococcus sp. 9903 TaxID=2582677 RepID=UPI001564AC3B
MFRKSNKDNGEKIFRYSIRKYHFGAASVAVAALMFFANGVQAQAPDVSLATASEVVAGSAGNPDGNLQESDEGELKETVIEQPAEGKLASELKAQGATAEEANQGQELDRSKPAPVGQEGPQVGEIKEREESTPTADKTAAKSTQGTLEALLANLTLDSMKALHAEVEEGLAKAKAVLENPKATQAQVDEQVRAMEELTSRVNQALEPSLPKLTDLGEAGSTNNKLVEPNGTATEQATGGKRRKRGGLTDLEPAANQVSPTDGGKEAAPEANSQSTPQELPTYTNTTEGENGVYGLKKELEDITKKLRRYGASEDKIQAAKAAADKFNEAFSKGDTISQEDFAAALVDLKKSRDLIEGVLEEKYGEETTVGGVTPQPRDGGYSDFRNATYSGRSARSVRAGENYSEEFKTARESYFERTDIEGHSPYDKYTYVFYSNRKPRDESVKLASEGSKYLTVTVKPTDRGFRWTIEINKDNYRMMPGLTEVWFTIPSGQTVRRGTEGISYHERSGGTYAPAQDGLDLVEKLKRINLGFREVTKGTISHSGLGRQIGPLAAPRGSLEELATWRAYNTQPYERRAESTENQAISNEKISNIKRDAAASLYYLRLPNSDRSYKLSFETEGNRDLGKLDYAAGMRGKDGNEVFLVNQWHSRTTSEFKGNALQQIEQALRDKNSSITGNRNLSQVEQKGATAKVETFARNALRRIDQAQHINQVESALNQGLSDIRNVNPVGRELPKQEVIRKAQAKK